MLVKPTVPIGKSLTVQKLITEADTAERFGSGKLQELLATPSLVGLMIEASVKLIDHTLPEGFISVGKVSEVDHEKTTILGETVSVKVEVEKFDGNKIDLKMIAFDEVGLIAVGRHRRIVVNEQSLVERARKRAMKLESMDY